jgi:nitrous oxidase accessory protein NosD
MQLKNVKKFLSFLVFFAFIFLTALISSEAFSATIYVPDNYNTIQAAVDAASPGDTIIVRDGTYTENVDVNKERLTIQSENGAEATIVQAANPEHSVFGVAAADHVNISGFTVKGAIDEAGITLATATNCFISNNIISDNGDGISLTSLRFDSYIVGGSYNNIIVNNNIYSHFYDIRIEYSFGNKIYLNNFHNGNCFSDLVNTWNSPEKIIYIYNGKTFANYLGNFWNNYTGIDADGNGIVDTAYVIDSCEDYYPLLNSFENYLSTLWSASIDDPQGDAPSGHDIVHAYASYGASIFSVRIEFADYYATTPYSGMGVRIKTGDTQYVLGFCTSSEYWGPKLAASYDGGTAWQLISRSFGGNISGNLITLWVNISDIGALPWTIEFISGIVFSQTLYEIKDSIGTLPLSEEEIRRQLEELARLRQEQPPLSEEEIRRQLEELARLRQEQITVPDKIPPSTVTDLTVNQVTTDSVALTWPAPGDDGNVGRASQYDIRYSTSPITGANWNSATQATGEPTPQSVGNTEAFTVTSLSPGATYYFALKTADEVPNWSGPSNVVSGTTGPGPADIDSDNLPDVWENQYFGNLNQGPQDDPDGDGLTNLEEYSYGTDPTKRDTDGDGYYDKEERDSGTNPNDPNDYPATPLRNVIQQEAKEIKVITVEGSEYYVVTLKRYIDPITWEPSDYSFFAEEPPIWAIYTYTNFQPISNEDLVNKLWTADRANKLLEHIGSPEWISDSINIIDNVINASEGLSNAEDQEEWAKTAIFEVLDLVAFAEIGVPIGDYGIGTIIFNQLDRYTDPVRYEMAAGRALLEASKGYYQKAQEIAESHPDGISDYTTAKNYLNYYYNGYFKSSYGVSIALPAEETLESPVWTIAMWAPEYIDHLALKVTSLIPILGNIGQMLVQTSKTAENILTIADIAQYIETKLKKIEEDVNLMFEHESFPVDYALALLGRSKEPLSRWGINGIDEINYNLCSPAEIRVYDSQGRCTGLVIGEVRMEIPNSFYFYSSHTVKIFFPSDSYVVDVVGAEGGTYGLEGTFVENGEATTFSAADIPTTSGAVHQYNIDWDELSQGGEGVTIKIDSDGNGIFEQTITTGSEFIGRPIKVSGGAYFYPETLTYRASFSMDVTGPLSPSGWLKYYYTRTRMNFVSTGITSVSASGNMATISGTGIVNGVGGYTFTAAVTNGSPDSFGIVIKKSSGSTYYSAGPKNVSGGDLAIQ